MINEEQYIKQHMGDRTQTNHPFSVPEGYFEQLTSSVMSRLPDGGSTAHERQAERGEKPIRTRLLRPWMAAAACMTAVIIVAAATLFNTGGQETATTERALATVNDGDTYFDEAADYAMMDNQDIYACLLAEI